MSGTTLSGTRHVSGSWLPRAGMNREGKETLCTIIGYRLPVTYRFAQSFTATATGTILYSTLIVVLPTTIKSFFEIMQTLFS